MKGKADKTGFWTGTEIQGKRELSISAAGTDTVRPLTGTMELSFKPQMLFRPGIEHGMFRHIRFVTVTYSQLKPQGRHFWTTISAFFFSLKKKKMQCKKDMHIVRVMFQKIWVFNLLNRDDRGTNLPTTKTETKTNHYTCLTRRLWPWHTERTVVHFWHVWNIRLVL